MSGIDEQSFAIRSRGDYVTISFVTCPRQKVSYTQNQK